jgi:hypothetical protein
MRMGGREKSSSKNSKKRDGMKGFSIYRGGVDLRRKESENRRGVHYDKVDVTI